MAKEIVSISIQPNDFVQKLEDQLGQKRMDAVVLEGTRKVAAQTANRMRVNYRAAGIQIHHPADGLFKSIRYKRIRRRYSEIGYWVGPMSRTRTVKRAFARDITKVVAWGAHRHLIEFGHRIVSHAGVDSGRRTKARPFIGPAFSGAVGSIEATVGDSLQKYIDSTPPIT